MNNKKVLFGILLLIFLVNFVFSMQIYFKTNQAENFCLVGGNCTAVQTSEYAKTFGVPNTIFGMMAFGFLTLFFGYSFFEKDKKLTLVAKTIMILSSITAIWFIFVMAFILKDWCSSCLWVDITTILGTIVFLSMKKV